MKKSKPLENGAGNARPRMLTGTTGWTWTLGLSVLLGVAASLLVAAAVFHFPVFAGPLGAAVVVILPPVIFISAIGFRYGTARLVGLWGQVKWWHWLWLLAFDSAIVWVFREYEAGTSVQIDAWNVLRIVPELIIAAVLIIRLALRRPSWLGSLFRGLVGALAIYALVCAVSTTWSVYRTWTLYKSWEYLVDVSILAAILATIDSAGDFHKFLNWTWLLYGLQMVWVWMGIFIWPSEALQPPEGRTGGFALNGVFPVTSANDVGFTGAVLAVIALARLLPVTGRRSDRAWYFLLFLFGIASIILSQTRSAVAGLLAGMLLIFFFSKRAKLGAAVTLGTASVLLLTGAGDAVRDFLERGQTSEGLTTLTGRLSWWTFAWQEVVKRPFTGLGAYAGGRFGVFEKLGLDTSNLHSDWMEILAGTSFWGLLPMVVAFIGAWWFLIRFVRSSEFSAFERQLALECIAVLAAISVRSVFNSELTWHAPLLFLAVVGYAEFLRRKAKSRAGYAGRRVEDATDSPAPSVATS